MQKQVYTPSEDCLRDFFEIYHPIIDTKQNLDNEETKLVNLRDNLLPRLMSGELKITEVEEV